MSRWIAPAALSLMMCLTSASSAISNEIPAGGKKKAGSHSKTTPSSPGGIEHSGVVVAVERLDADQVKAIFDVDLLKKSIQPVVIEIHNGSEKTYRFAKANVDAPYLPAAQVATYAYPNPLVQSARFIRGSISFIPFVIFKAVHHAKWHRPELNREIQADYTREEIRDAEIAPNGSLSGFMFLKGVQSQARIQVKLIEVNTQAPLVFDVPPGS